MEISLQSLFLQPLNRIIWTVDKLFIILNRTVGTFCDSARDGFENADMRNRCQAFDTLVPLKGAETLHVVEIPEMLKCAFCLLSTFCNFKLEFLDSLNGIVDR